MQHVKFVKVFRLDDRQKKVGSRAYSALCILSFLNILACHAGQIERDVPQTHAMLR